MNINLTWGFLLYNIKSIFKFGNKEGQNEVEVVKSLNYGKIKCYFRLLKYP